MVLRTEWSVNLPFSLALIAMRFINEDNLSWPRHHYCRDPGLHPNRMESPLSTWLGDGDYGTVCKWTQDTSMASCDLRTFWEQMHEGEWSSPSVFLSPFNWTLWTLPHFHLLSELNPPHISCRLSWTPWKPNSLALKYHTVFIRDWGVSLPNCLVSYNFSSSFLLRGCATFGRFPRPFCFKSLLRDSNTFLLSFNSLESTRL